MLQVKLTGGTTVAVEVDNDRVWIKTPNNFIGFMPDELTRLSAVAESLKTLHLMLLWIKALRSGRFEQGIYNLCNNEQYCCLGVLCEVAIEFGYILSKHTTQHGPIQYGGNTEMLPDGVQALLGCPIRPSLLARMNDKDGKTFDDIADYLEQTYVLPRFQ